MHSLPPTRALQIQGASDVLGLPQQDFVIIVARAQALFQVAHDTESLRLGFSGATPIERFALVAKGELPSALGSLHPSKQWRRLPVVPMRRQPQSLGVGNDRLP